VAAPNIYDVGDQVVLRGDFKDRNGAPTNPTTVTMRVRKPDGAVVIVTNANVGTGAYEGTYDPPSAGEYVCRVEGTGAVKAAGETRFKVRDQQVA
jgi:uncharacterized protein YfaS (alpha-2-macroglobulin family)